MGEVVYLADRADQHRQLLWREAIGHVVRQERHTRRERLTDVGERAGIAPQYLSELERGLKDPSSEVLHAVSDALETPVHEIARRAASVLDGTACLGPTVLAITA